MATPDKEKKVSTSTEDPAQKESGNDEPEELRFAPEEEAVSAYLHMIKRALMSLLGSAISASLLMLFWPIP